LFLKEERAFQSVARFWDVTGGVLVNGGTLGYPAERLCRLDVRSVSDRSRALELAASESTQQSVKLVAETAGWQGDTVFDGAGVPIDDTNVDTVFQKQCDHARVVVRNQCGEVAYAFLTGTINKPFQELDAQSPALPVIDDGDGDFGALWVLGVPDEASDAKAATVDRIQGAERLVVVVVDRGQVTHLGRSQVPFPPEESQLARFTAQAGETVSQQRRVPALNLSNQHN
jgi:hypothetical protein